MHGLGGVVDWGIFERHQLAANAIGVAIFVQHGTSTISQDQFKEMPRVGTGEAHLATEYQKITFDLIAKHSPELAAQMNDYMAALMNPELTEEQLTEEIVES